VAAEYEAIQLYTQLADSTANPLAAEVLKDVADEERVHAGEFLRLLREIAPDEEKLYAEGAEEVEAEIGKTKLRVGPLA
jgi:rubrerythrin